MIYMWKIGGQLEFWFGLTGRHLCWKQVLTDLNATLRERDSITADLEILGFKISRIEGFEFFRLDLLSISSY